MSRYQPSFVYKVLLVSTIGVGLSLWLLYYFHQREYKRREQVVIEATEAAKVKLQAELNKVPLIVSSLHLLMEKVDTISRETFTEFAVPFLKNLAGIRALEWAPYVPQAERNSHVQQLRAEGMDWYHIRVPHQSERRLIPAPEKPYYYPIQYIEPAPLTKMVLGYDISAEPARLDMIQESEKNHRLMVSPPARLVQNKEGTRSFIVLRTIAANSKHHGALLGVYNAKMLVDTVLGDELDCLDIFLFDQTADQLPIYNSQRTDSLPSFARVIRHDWLAADTLEVGNRNWLLYAQPKQDFFIFSMPLDGYGFAIAALLLTLLLIGIMGTNARLENKVATRTEQLHRANMEQAVLLKEIHHRVKNNLQVITGLLSLQASSLTDSNIKALFSVSQYRINAMAMLHEQLYQSENLSTIEYGSYLRQMVEQLTLSMKGLQHSIAVDWQIPAQLKLNLDTAIPLGLLINELVTNSLKYGFPDNRPGQLYIHLIPEAYPTFLLLIGDDGVGFPQTITSTTSHSLGLKLVRQLARQLNGHVERLRRTEGTHYSIRFHEVQ